MEQPPIPETGQRGFVASGPPAPRNWLRIASMFSDFGQKVTIDFDQRQIVFEDVMLPNKFLTLWFAEQITVGFDEITKLRDDELDGTHVFTVLTTKGKAALGHHRFEEIDELRELISQIYEQNKKQ